MYSSSSRDLAHRAHLTDSRLIVDLCGGTGVTAEAILSLAPPDARVISLDSAAAMQRIGRRTINDPRLSWAAAPAEDLAMHAPAHAVDAVVCNSAIWKTDVPAVFASVHRVLRPGGRFVFNVGGGLASVTHPDGQTGHTGPSLRSLIQQIAARDYGYTPLPTNGDNLKLPLPAITHHLADVGLLTLVDTEVTAPVHHHGGEEGMAVDPGICLPRRRLHPRTADGDPG
ncbi:class I SAM-dependent methyltransferase [Streptomyces spirodelae]|uniref:class I SAM-dependent methyltransferase n=1 Tax=Streptomyces spirodelae TaxID=2812904 RepID=UPI001E5215DD|nr:class I SAM-dependent methyltransferase [Streptomyces spirodelae]